MAHTDFSTVIKDISIVVSTSGAPPFDFPLNACKWHPINKDLLLRSGEGKGSAWLYISQAKENELAIDDLVVTDIKVGELDGESGLDAAWESRSGGIWMLRKPYNGNIERALTGIDTLFGVDAVDPLSQWTLMNDHLQLQASWIFLSLG